MLILIVGGGRRTRRQDERARARAREKEKEFRFESITTARKICGFIRNNCCGKRNYAGICSEMVISISVIVRVSINTINHE